jgi:cell division protein FtsQ
MNDITMQVEDRLGPPRAKPVRQPKGGRSAGRQPPRRRWIPAVWWTRAKYTALALGVLGGGVALPAWLVHSGTGARLVDDVRGKIVALSARAGFRVEEIFVEGRNRTPRDQLLEALGVHRGDPIFGIDLGATRQRLEGISWVKTATIERRLPSEVHLLITERAPIVLWQSQGRYYLVDRDGQVVGDEVEEYADLPLMVGEGAPDHAAELLDLLGAEPELRRRVKAAQWVGDRRWNITLDRTSGGIDIRLPEENPIAAWHELANLERDQKLLERKIALVDMRLPDRLVLRATGGAEESSAPTAMKRKAHPGKDT